MVVALVALSGCSGAGDLAVQRSGGSVMMASANEPDASMTAVVGGTLTPTDRGCLALGEQRTATPLVFPYGSKLAADGQTVEVPHGGLLRIGDEVTHGGGMGSLVNLNGVPDECQAGTDVAIWN